MNRPKNTAHTPQRRKMRSAFARWAGPKCFGKRRPHRSSSARPPRRPIAYPIESPTIAPVLAAMATHHTLVTPFAASKEALIRVISPGTGMPRLSIPMTPPTTR